MSIPHLYYPSFPPIKRENDLLDQPLDLSFNSLKKKVEQQLKDRISIQQISEESSLSIDGIYSIISKTSLVKIKDFGRYTLDIKYRLREAQKAGKTLAEIAKIFGLKPYQAPYINRCNRAFLIKQLCHSVNTIPNRGSPMTTEKLKTLLHRRRIQSSKKT